MPELPIKKGLVAWVDAEDARRFGHLKWTSNKKGHVCRDGATLTGKPGVVFLNRLIVGATSDQEVRHRNNIKMDCRRENLAIEPRKPKPTATEEDLSLIV